MAGQAYHERYSLIMGSARGYLSAREGHPTAWEPWPGWAGHELEAYPSWGHLRLLLATAPGG